MRQGKFLELRAHQHWTKRAEEVFAEFVVKRYPTGNIHVMRADHRANPDTWGDEALD